jgi:hypothetical protein
MSHTSQYILSLKLEKARSRVKIGAKYYHYKNPSQIYIVEFIGLLEGAEEVCVGYRAIYGEGILWVRTLANFLEKINKGSKRVSRFVKIP